MRHLQYLTVQDVLWINLQLTKKVQHFNHARLEEGTAYQYAYGESKSLVPQAGRFLSGFLKMRPFDAGNEATAFVATAAFLKINGAELSVPDAQGREWFDGVATRQTLATDAIAKAVGAEREAHADDHHEMKADVRGAIRSVIERYPCTVMDLVAAVAK